jgi:hypothetical protein
MSNNKQNSVQWLIEKYTIVCGLGSKELMKEHIDRAKAMHKEEIRQTYQKGYNDADFSYYEPEHYYNETYGGNNEPTK